MSWSHGGEPPPAAPSSQSGFVLLRWSAQRHEHVPVSVDGVRHRRLVGSAVAVRRQALPVRTTVLARRAHRMRGDHVAHLGGSRPARRAAAVGAGRAGHVQDLLDRRCRARSRWRTTRRSCRPEPDDRIGALVVVARPAAERADRGVRAADLDRRRPRRTAVGRLAEVDRAMTFIVEPRPRDVDVVPLRARRVRVGRHQLLVVVGHRPVVVRDNSDRRVAVLLETARRIRRVVEAAAVPGVRLHHEDGVGPARDVEEDAADVRVAA